MNMLSRFVITFLPKSKRLLISRLQSPSAVIWEPKIIKSATVSTVSPSISHEVVGPDAMIFVFWNQSILKEISPGYSLEGLMLKLKLQYFGHLMGRVDSFEKNLMLGKIEGRKSRGQQRMWWLDGITESMDMSWWWTGKPGVLWFMGSQIDKTERRSITSQKTANFANQSFLFVFWLLKFYQHNAGFHLLEQLYLPRDWGRDFCISVYFIHCSFSSA